MVTIISLVSSSISGFWRFIWFLWLAGIGSFFKCSEISVDMVRVVGIPGLFLLAEHVLTYLVFGIRHLHVDNLETNFLFLYLQ